MTVDVGELTIILWGIHETWTGIAMTTAILIFIYTLIGDAIVVGLYCIAGAFAYNIIISTAMNYFFSKLMTHKDKRVSISTDIIQGIKSIKYLSWEEIFEKKI